MNRIWALWLLVLIVTGCEKQDAAKNVDLEDSKRCTANTIVKGADGIELAADCYQGKVSADKPAILFIHGAFQSRVAWSKQLEALAGQYQVITYDLRGHGDSERPGDIEAYQGPRIPARDAEAVLNYFDVDSVVLVGWSFGSIVASDIATYLEPERIAGLVLVSGTAESGTDRNRDSFGPLMNEVSAMYQDNDPEEEQRAIERFFEGSYIGGEWDKQLLSLVMDANKSIPASEKLKTVARPEYRYHSELNSLNLPILLIHGQEDNVIKVSSSVFMSKELEHSTLAIYEQTGHWPFLERYERFNSDLDEFIKAL